MPKKYEVVVFDWDGTVIDSAARIGICMQLAARDCGYPEPEHSQTCEIIGLSMHKAVQKLFAVEDKNQIERLIDAYRTHWLQDKVETAILFPGAQETLQQLTEQGYMLAIATGKNRRGLDKDLKRTGLAEYFHISRCADEAFSKPHPQMLLDVLVDLNTPPEKAIVIGDTEYDMQMAANAKVDAVGVSYGAHDAGRLVEQGALAIFSAMLDFPVWLEK